MPPLVDSSNRYDSRLMGLRIPLAWIPTEPFGPNIRVSAVA